jgi:protein transport protein YIF1
MCILITLYPITKSITVPFDLERSPQGYQRFTSSPPNPNVPMPHQQAYPQLAQAYPFQPQQQPPLQQHPSQRAPMGHMGQGTQMGAPDFAAWGMDDATAQFGMRLGQSAVAAGQDYVQKNVRRLQLFLVQCSKYS